MSIARDGTGGLVYRKDVAGVAHVFVSLLENGTFQAPVQVDPGLPGASSAPVIAGGQDGIELVAFINGGQLYVTQTSAAGGPFSAPASLYPAAATPSISISNFGKAYLAFTATNGAGGDDVRAAYYYQGQWALVPGALDANPADVAGTGTGRPAVATAGDGVGIVAWGENGHVYTRRVVKASPSAVLQQADVPSVDGWAEVSAGQPAISSGGDSTYASVVFQETIQSGSTHQSRVLVNRLHGSQYDGISHADGAVTGGSEGADQPRTVSTEYGDGFVSSELNQTHALFAGTLGTNESPGAIFRVDSLPNGAGPDAVPATAGLVSTFIAWQQTPGIAGPAEIRIRYAPDGSDLGPEQVISEPGLGATSADNGLVAAGDVSGDAAIGWVQGSGAGSQIVVAQLYQPPGGFVAASAFSYATRATPLLQWSGAAELWGSPEYVVKVDGTQIGATPALALAPAAPIANGRHLYQITAVNQVGLTSSAAPATVFVDTVAPRVSLRFTGSRIVNTAMHLHVTYSDPPPAGQPSSAASGVSKVYVSWGTGPQARVGRNDAAHTYTRIRTYTVTLTVTDKAGNRTVVARKLKIKAKAKPRKHKKKPKKSTRKVTHRGHVVRNRSRNRSRRR